MKKFEKVPEDALMNAGLELMRQKGQPLTRTPTKGRAKIYVTAKGETVRVRTCNDHLLVVLADKDAEDAKLNVEGTDYVLIVMPESARTHGQVMAFLVPAKVVEDAARTTHREWLASGPNTNGDNRTWNLWFDDKGPEKANGFARKWAKYRLSGSAVTFSAGVTAPLTFSGGAKLGDVIANARRQIAEVAGVPPEAVRISVDLA
jgi:hypothetical protein